jgi:prepilin-type N-terminal cleavage/methylation domain-containing protein
LIKHVTAREDWAEKNLGAKGFTLIELLVVIIILGVLAAVVIFAVGNTQENAERKSCRTEAVTLQTAIAAYKTGSIDADKLPVDEDDLEDPPDAHFDPDATEGFIKAPSDNYNVSGEDLSIQGTKCELTDIPG